MTPQKEDEVMSDFLNDPDVKKALSMQNEPPLTKYRGCNIWPEFDWAHPQWGIKFSVEQNIIWFGQGENLEDCKKQIDEVWSSQDRDISKCHSQ